MITSKRILWFVLAMCLACGLTGAYIWFIRPLTLPVYRLGEQAGQEPDFTENTLTTGDTTFISGASEFSLELTGQWVGKQRMIGRTEDGMEIYSIPGQDPDNYVMLTTLMFPWTVYRNADLPPVELATMDVDEIRLLQGTSREVGRSRDAELIAAIVAQLTETETVRLEADFAWGGTLWLLSDQLPGLAYAVSVVQTQDGAVYLVQRRTPEDWIAAGTEISAWIDAQISQ